MDKILFWSLNFIKVKKKKNYTKEPNFLFFYYSIECMQTPQKTPLLVSYYLISQKLYIKSDNFMPKTL